MDSLLAKVDELLSGDPLVRARFLFNQKDGSELSKLYSCSRLIERSYIEDQVLVEVEAPQSLVERLKDFRVQA